MATKAERFRAESQVENSSRKTKTKKAPARSAPVAKPHNLGERAGRTAVVTYESSNGRPSRKSTRKSKNHQRPNNALERTAQLKRTAPEARAAKSRARSVKIRGKS